MLNQQVKTFAILNGALWIACIVPVDLESAEPRMSGKPNVLIAISDDQSYPHASAYDCRFVSTPGFDEIARSGVLYRNAYAATPGCSPSRASLLTGLHAWQLEHAGTHASEFPARFRVFPDILEEAGYRVGFTGKGWGPGNWRRSGRSRNPCGDAYQSEKLADSPSGISNNNYSENFKSFLETRDEGQPFCFWYGATEPHRGFHSGIGRDQGKLLDDVDVPSFLPDSEVVRDDLLDYAVEIEWFDQHLMRMIEHLESIGERDNTLIIVTSDNGMAFPRAKANLYEYGVHVPLAISWPAALEPGQREDELVGFIDLTATILDAADVPFPEEYELPGSSLLAEGTDSERRPADDVVFCSRERHSSSRYRSLGYPQRCIRSEQFLLVWNITPERWPAGAPVKFGRGGYPRAEEVISETMGPDHGGYHDIDACPTLTWMIAHCERPDVEPLFALSVGMRVEYELFDVDADPGCLTNLYEDPTHESVATQLRDRLHEELRRTGDPRMGAGGHVFETYERYSNIRYFPTPDWAKENEDRVPVMPWWQRRRAALEGRENADQQSLFDTVRLPVDDA